MLWLLRLIERFEDELTLTEHQEGIDDRVKLTRSNPLGISCEGQTPFPNALKRAPRVVYWEFIPELPW